MLQTILAYMEAVRTIDPLKAVGRVYKLWQSFASYYEGHGDLDNARVILGKAVEVDYRCVDIVVMCHCTRVCLCMAD